MPLTLSVLNQCLAVGSVRLRMSTYVIRSPIYDLIQNNKKHGILKNHKNLRFCHLKIFFKKFFAFLQILMTLKNEVRVQNEILNYAINRNL